jgi:hypothetical protein
MLEPKEADILRDCLMWLKLHGVFCWRQNQGAIAGEHNGKRRFLRFSSAPGISDIIGLLPPAGKLLAIECKRPGRHPTPEQLAFLEVIRSSGGIALCVHSLEELERLLTDSGHWPPRDRAAS